MAIDLYALCPCGSGKKIKFCCRDLAGEIGKIERMMEAGQRQACLEHIELLERKYPNRTYLLARKAELQRELGREADADGTLKSLLEQERENPVALAESALLALTKEGEDSVPTAIDYLQRAVEVSPRDPWPEKVREALAAVADECFAANYLPACLAHTVLFLQADPDNEGAVNAISQFAASAQVPLPFKEMRPFHKCPQDVPWRDHFNDALSLADRGYWLLAEERLTELEEQGQSVPALWHNLALLRMWLAKEEEAIAALQKLSTLDVPPDDAAEAAALALQLDASPILERVEVSRLTYPVRDMERIITTTRTDRRCVDQPMRLAHTQDQAPPRSTHLVLDRPAPESATELTPETVPIVSGYLFVYGKETDREARLEIHLARDERYETNKALLAEIFGDAVGPPEESVDGEKSISPLWEPEDIWLPPTMPSDERYDLRLQRQRRYCFENWPSRPLKFLDGKTPQQAAHDPQLRVRVLGLLLFLEVNSQREKTTEFDFDGLRRQLGLPVPAAIEGQDLDVSDVPLTRLARVRMEQLSDQDVFKVFSRSASYRAAAAAEKAALEMAKRPAFDEKPGIKTAIYTTLAHLTPDSRQALEHLDKARRFAEADGRSCAEYDIQELVLRIRRGDGSHFNRLMDHLTQHHIDEPGVRQALRDILMSLGVIHPDGTVAVPMEPEAAADESAREAPAIWTPDSPAATSGDKPRILLPS
jgi:tetratricopeptide (TPR) repeat protein